VVVHYSLCSGFREALRTTHPGSSLQAKGVIGTEDPAGGLRVAELPTKEPQQSSIIKPDEKETVVTCPAMTVTSWERRLYD